MWRALALSLAFLVTSPSIGASTEPARTREATVVHVDDGDTIDVWVDSRSERVRYIGIDAPEIVHDGVGGERGGDAATRLNKALVGGRRVRLELDRERRDRYGRLLAYVWADQVMINLEMVRRGYARTLTIPPNIRYERWFARAEAEAQAAHLGLWGDGDPNDPAFAPRRARPPSGDPHAFRPFLARRDHARPVRRQAEPAWGRRSAAVSPGRHRSSRLPRIPFGRKMMNSTSRIP
jgi:micrococcal nuclease